MPATITYKGNTIATAANNATKTLLTAGKYLEGDVIVTVAPWNHLGDEAELVEEIYPKTATALSSTGFSTWTPSTTAGTIVSAQTLSSKAFTADFTQYEYLLRWRWSVVPEYTAGATLKAQIDRECAEQWQVICKRPNSLANIQSENFNGNACITYFSAPLLSYYNASGTKTYTHSISYGIYCSVTAATFSSTTSNTATVTPKTPSWAARCSSTYFSTTSAPELDQANTKLYLRGELYRLKLKGTVRHFYEDLYDIYNDPTNP